MVRRITIVLILFGLIAGIYILQERLDIEKENNKVALILDYDEYSLFAYNHGYDLWTLLNLLHKAGANTLAISEETLDKLKLKGKLTYMTGADFLYTSFAHDAEKIIQGATYIVSQDSTLLSNLEKEFSLRLGSDKLIRERDDLLIVKATPDVLSEYPLYYPEDVIKKAKDMGFYVSLRVTNFLNVNKDSVDEIFKRIKKVNPINIIFAGEEVLGYPDYALIKNVVKYLKDEKIPYGIIEFTNQRGMKFLSQYLPELALRVHSISKDELEDMPFRKAVDRWIRAVKERNMRLLFIKPIPIPGDLLKINTSYINDILKGIERIGYKKGIPLPLPFVPLNVYIVILLSFLSFLAFYYVAKVLLSIPGEEVTGKLINIIALLWILLFFLLVWKDLSLASKFSALTAACAYPTLAIIVNDKYFKDKYRDDAKGAVLSAILGLFEISLVSFVGALIVAALLSSTPFMLSIDKFTGVKIAYLLPVLLAMIYLWKKKNMEKYPIITTLKKQIKVGDIVILGILGMIGILFILRSGNFSIMSIPGFEEKVRIFLEHTLIARPRTKEFFIGHPLLMLTIFWGYLRIRTYKIAFVGIGVIGQTTLVNSFCHIHTPLHIALLRTFNGIWLGIFMGLLYIAIFYIGYLLYKKYRRIIY